jgi:hypothetical protein
MSKELLWQLHIFGEDNNKAKPATGALRSAPVVVFFKRQHI